MKGDDFERVLEFARRKVAAIASRIFSGQIEANPARMGPVAACGTCIYRPVCRFDWQINEFKELVGKGKKEILEELGADTDGVD